MDASTISKQTRIEQCKINAKARSEQKRQATFDALSALQQEHQAITKAAVARRAGVSLVFLRSHPDLMQAVEGAEKSQRTSSSSTTIGDTARNHVIAALRRRMDDMKQQLAAKDEELHKRQRVIDQLYGKLAAASPMTNSELRHALTDALERLAQQEIHTAETN